MTTESGNEPLLSQHPKDKSEKPAGAIFFGIEAKTGFSKLNILAIPVSIISASIVGAFVNT